VHDCLTALFARHAHASTDLPGYSEHPSEVPLTTISGENSICARPFALLCAAKGHTAVLQAAVEAVKLGTKESFSEENDDISMKHVRAWSKLLKDCLNQKGSRGETPVMVACEEG